MGLSGPYSNYKMLSEKVKEIKPSAPVKAEPDPTLVDLSYDPNHTIKTLRQQQKHEFSNKEIREIVAAYQNGASTYDLAEQYDCHRSTIARHLRNQGVKVSIEKIDMDDAILLPISHRGLEACWLTGSPRRSLFRSRSSCPWRSLTRRLGR